MTTILDAEQTTKEDLAKLYRARWNNELDFRSLKTTMQMDAYNLIRTIIAQAATKYDREPRSISFKGTVQTLEAFQPIISIFGKRNAKARALLYRHLL